MVWVKDLAGTTRRTTPEWLKTKVEKRIGKVHTYIQSI